MQDGPDTTFTTSSRSRIIRYDLALGLPDAEFVYLVAPRTIDSTPPGGAGSRGLCEMLAIDDQFLLSLEREYAAGTTSGEGTRPVRLHEIKLDGKNVLRRRVLDGSERPVSKRLLLDFDDLRVNGTLTRVGSFEALAWGPSLPDDRRILLVMEDNDFERPAQILAFAVELRR